MTYPLHTRAAALAAFKAGEGAEDVAYRFGIERTTLYKWAKKGRVVAPRAIKPIETKPSSHYVPAKKREKIAKLLKKGSTAIGAFRETESVSLNMIYRIAEEENVTLRQGSREVFPEASKKIVSAYKKYKSLRLTAEAIGDISHETVRKALREAHVRIGKQGHRAGSPKSKRTLEKAVKDTSVQLTGRQRSVSAKAPGRKPPSKPAFPAPGKRA